MVLRFLGTLDPLTAREVGNRHGSTAHSDRLLGKARDTHHSNGIVSIDRRSNSLAYRFDKRVIYKPVDTVVTADGILAVFLPYRMFVLFGIGFSVIKLIPYRREFAFAIQMDIVTVSAIHTLSAADGKSAGVDTRKSCIESKNSSSSVGTFKNSSDYIALSEVILSNGIVGTVFESKLMETLSAGGYRIKSNKAVAVIDIENLHNGAELVGGIVFTVTEEIVSLAVVTVNITVNDFLAKIVHISARTMNYISEQAFAHHIERHKLTSSVAAVFEHHTMDTGFLISTNQAEAVFNVISTANLYAYGLTRAHRSDTHIDMGFPSGQGKNSLNVGVGNNFLPIGSTEGTHACFFLDKLRAGFGTVGIIVANSGNFDNTMLAHRHKAGLKKTVAAITKTDNTDLYFSHTHKHIPPQK